MRFLGGKPLILYPRTNTHPHDLTCISKWHKTRDAEWTWWNKECPFNYPASYVLITRTPAACSPFLFHLPLPQALNYGRAPTYFLSGYSTQVVCYNVVWHNSNAVIMHLQICIHVQSSCVIVFNNLAKRELRVPRIMYSSQVGCNAHNGALPKRHNNIIYF